jgi:nucleoid-associated protein
VDIKSVVVHEIIKVEKKTGATVFLSDIALDHTSEEIIGMIASLESSFSKKTLKRAKFNDKGFKAHIADFKIIDLLKHSNLLTTELQKGIQNIPAAKGGYLVFCEYTNIKKFLAVFLVRDTKGSLLKAREDKGWDVKPSEYLDVEHYAMGARINLDILLSTSEDRYISLVKGNTDISEYFENWIGLDNSKPESKDADALYDLSNNITLPEGVTNRDEFKKQIFDYVKSIPSRTINLRDLSKHLFNDDGVINEYCDKNDIDLDGEFKISPKQLGRFFKVSVKAGGIELTAPRSSFSPQGINVSNDGLTVIIRSKELAQELSKTLKE